MRLQASFAHTAQEGSDQGFSNPPSGADVLSRLSMALTGDASRVPHILELTSPTLAPKQATSPVSRESWRKLRTPEAAKLRESRLWMGLTMIQMAEALGVSHSVYCAMEYGRSKVRPEIFDRLREVETSSSDVYEFYAGAVAKGVPALLAGWAKRLDATDANDSKLAALLGVDKSTISRWKSGIQAPTRRQIIAIEHNVSLSERAIKRAAEAIKNRLETGSF